MKKQIAIVLSLIMASHFGVSAQKTHKSTNHRVQAAHAQVHYSKKKKAHKKKKVDTRPVITVNDVKDLETPWGIDVSHYQSNINWTTLELEKPHFMFIKASEGLTIKDEKYNSYYAEARKMGIPVGSYHFFSYKSTGREQAENFLSSLQLQPGDLLPVLDAERTRSLPADKQKVTNELTDFINAVYEKLGIYPIIYCTHSYYQTYLNETIQDKCKLWIVDYKAKPECDWTLWQTTNKFKLMSINGHVDLNFYNGSKENLKELFYQQSDEQFLLDASL
jgi:lysozyme